MLAESVAANEGFLFFSFLKPGPCAIFELEKTDFLVQCMKYCSIGCDGEIVKCVPEYFLLLLLHEMMNM